MPSCVIAVNVAPGSPQPASVAHDAQVRARRDRQELGQALDEAEDDRLDESHEGRYLSGLEQAVAEHGTAEGERVERAPARRRRGTWPGSRGPGRAAAARIRSRRCRAWRAPCCRCRRSSDTAAPGAPGSWLRARRPSSRPAGPRTARSRPMSWCTTSISMSGPIELADAREHLVLLAGERAQVDERLGAVRDHVVLVARLEHRRVPGDAQGRAQESGGGAGALDQRHPGRRRARRRAGVARRRAGRSSSG